jgi:hypothetical protein
MEEEKEVGGIMACIIITPNQFTHLPPPTTTS